MKSPPRTSAAPAKAPASAPSPLSPSAAVSPTPAAGPIKVIKAPKQGFALVKAVTSGDTMVVAGNTTQAGQQLPEKTIIVSGITAPKFAKGKNQTDEPFAWESREYLRKKVIGQQIKFDIGYTHEDSGREYAVVFFNGENLAIDLLQHGWAKVKTSTSKDGKERTGPEDLVAAQSEAQQAGRGVWLKGVAPERNIRSINFAPDPRALFDAAKGSPIPAVVDQVRDGSTLRVELLNGTEPLQHTSIFLHLAGVQCPRTPLPLSVLQSQHDARVKEGKKGVRPEEEAAAEPWALEAQEFTELRLLHRDVQVLIQGTDKLGNFFGTIQYPKSAPLHPARQLSLRTRSRFNSDPMLTFVVCTLWLCVQGEHQREAAGAGLRQAGALVCCADPRGREAQGGRGRGEAEEAARLERRRRGLRVHRRPHRRRPGRLRGQGGAGHLRRLAAHRGPRGRRAQGVVGLHPRAASGPSWGEGRALRTGGQGVHAQQARGTQVSLQLYRAARSTARICLQIGD